MLMSTYLAAPAAVLARLAGAAAGALQAASDWLEPVAMYRITATDATAPVFVHEGDGPDPDCPGWDVVESTVARIHARGARASVDVVKLPGGIVERLPRNMLAGFAG